MIAAFIVDRMANYLNGGMRPETAARFTLGELGAIYRGNHISRDESGAMRPTPPPEKIPIEAARAKCNEAIREILDCCREEAARKKTKQAMEKTHGVIPAAIKRTDLDGFEKLAGYARRPA